ncbi:hypothetical protein FSP39_009993 [Pinctada imbricata]|uniref:Fibrinogen C-terminal domain-containing protein n=1 Tax=Pinctada imbricata TaxID=66713 RepID=A0AA89BQX5_PINIB|nr:hypothetical protein FSP39_009993 [Pinctada imbricata]
MLRLYRAMSGEIERISKENAELKQDLISLMNTTANTDILSSQIQFLNTTMTSALLNITKIQTEKPEDCKEILSSEPNSRSGVYTIYPDGTKGYSVYCDMTSQGGGWTVIQRRINGILDYDKTWKEYKDGFGDLIGEHWIGDGLNKDGYGDNNNMMFSTKDRDNDQWDKLCANHHKGGWWFKKCEYGCLNCKYLGSDSTWDAIQYKSTWMMIR